MELSTEAIEAHIVYADLGKARATTAREQLTALKARIAELEAELEEKDETATYPIDYAKGHCDGFREAVRQHEADRERELFETARIIASGLATSQECDKKIVEWSYSLASALIAERDRRRKEA